MTTLFEETDNTNPPSPSLELLDTPTLKNELEPDGRKISTNTSTAANGEISFLATRCLIIYDDMHHVKKQLFVFD